MCEMAANVSHLPPTMATFVVLPSGTAQQGTATRDSGGEKGRRRLSELLPTAQRRESASSDQRSSIGGPSLGEAEDLSAELLIHQQQQNGGEPPPAVRKGQQPPSSLGSDGTLSRSLSSPELLQLPLLSCPHQQQQSSTPSPLPTNEYSLLTAAARAKCSPNSASTQLMQLSSSSSLQSLRGSHHGQQQQPQRREQQLASRQKSATSILRPKVNGSAILSIDIGRLAIKAAAASSPCAIDRRRHSSGGSTQSEAKRNQIIALTASVGNAIQRTRRELQRTRLWHVFYAFALPIYTVAGALVFQALDGAHDDRQRELYERRCLDDRELQMASLEHFCAGQIGAECFARMRLFLAEVESCYRRWHEVNKTITHPMSDFTNAVIYAFSVYTTIGYGTISASSIAARVATVFYGLLGIPLFFAFIKEEGNMFRTWFIWLYGWVKRQSRKRMSAASGSMHFPAPLRKLSSACRSTQTKSRGSSADECCESCPLASQQQVCVQPLPVPPTVGDEDGSGRNSSISAVKGTRFSTQPPFVRNCSDYSLAKGGATRPQQLSAGRQRMSSECGSAAEQRRVFFCGVLVLWVYLLAVSALFAFMSGWDLFTSFYFLFNSVALIGFGDVFPSQSRIILANMCFIVLGVVLFSMCYFILQEEIRAKAFEASRKVSMARTSLAKYSQSLMLHTRPWSRRNSPAFDNKGGSPGPNPNAAAAFDRHRKRRQSAPAITVELNNSNNIGNGKSSRKPSPPLRV